MSLLIKTVSRIGAYALAGGVTASAALIMAGDPNWWMAGVAAVAPHLLWAMSELLKAYGNDGKLDDAEVETIVKQSK